MLGNIRHQLGNNAQALEAEAYEDFRSRVSALFGHDHRDATIASLLISSIYHFDRDLTAALAAARKLAEIGSQSSKSLGSGVAFVYNELGELFVTMEGLC